MFKAANKIDPNAKLFVNDFDVFAQPTYTQVTTMAITSLYYHICILHRDSFPR